MIEKYESAKRDLSGSTTQNRFKYQNFWTISKILELYEEEHEDFAVIFEGLSDTDVIINNKDIHLFQLKTTKSNIFNVAKLIHNKKGQESILSNLAKRELNEEAETFNIVTNTILKEKSDQQELCLFDLKEENKNQIIIHIKDKLNFDPDLKKYFYSQSDLCLYDSETLILGKIVKFLEKKFKTDSVRSTYFLSFLTRIANKKSTYEFNEKGLKKLIEKKGISKKEFEDILKEYDSHNPYKIENVKNKINSLHYYNMYQKIEMNRALISITKDLSTLRLKKILKKIKLFILENKEKLKKSSESEILDAYLNEVFINENEFNEYEKKCLILIAFEEYEKGE